MKKLSLILLLIVFAGALTEAQTLLLFMQNGQAIQEGDTLEVSGLQSDGEIIAHINVFNNSTGDVSVICRKEYIDIISGTENSFCWAMNCYPPTTFVSNGTQSITANDTCKEFSGHYYPYGIAGVSIVKYVFSISHGDSTWAYVKYNAAATGIFSQNNQVSSLRLYPNPVKDIASLLYPVADNANAKLEIYNICGKLELSLPLQSGKTLHSINLNSLKQGVYICNLVVNNQSISSSKLIVTK